MIAKRDGFHRPARRARRPQLDVLEARRLLDGAWGGYARNAQHTALSTTASQPLDTIRWSAPVDLAPQYSGNDLLIHYGSPLSTAAGTTIVPVKTGATDGFEVQARRSTDGALIWTQSTDYLLPPHNWTPSFSPTLAGNRLYFAGAGGTIDSIDSPDTPGAKTPVQVAFYGIANYTHDGFDNSVYVNTPITADAAGDIYFGFRVTGSNPLGLTDGVARIDAQGHGTWVTTTGASGDPNLTQMAMNSAPALSNDGATLYVVVDSPFGSGGDLLALDSTTLATTAKAALVDPQSNLPAAVIDDSTASPMVGPDGDVYIGVLENPFASNHDRGWLLHFSGDLATSKDPGAFGWDDTPSIVPASMVASYHGTSSYLLMTKFNNYAGIGGNGDNRVAVLDPNSLSPDPFTGYPAMTVVESIKGPTPDPSFDQFFPGAVREWCINTAAVDPATDSILVNSEDGTLYRWDLASNTFSQHVRLTSGIGEAYTPTVIGSDGTVYAINNATLFAVGIPHPATRLVVTAQPFQGFAAGQGFTLTVAAEDDFGHVDTTYNGPVALALASGPAGATLGGTTTVRAVHGVATFRELTLRLAGNYTIQARAGTLISATTDAIVVTPASATHLVVTTLPTSVAAGSSFVLAVSAEDRFGNVATSYNGTVTLSLASGPAGATVGGTLTATVVHGVATFHGLSLTRAGTYKFQAVADGLAAATSGPVAVTPAAANHLVVTTQPPVTITAGGAFAMTVTAEDRFGNVDTSYFGFVDLTLASGPAGASFNGFGFANNGVATFSGLRLTIASSYTLRATAFNLKSATTDPIVVKPGAPSLLAVRTPPPGVVAAGAPFGLAFVVEDRFGNVVTSYSGDVTLALVVDPGGSTLGGTTTVAAVNGLVTFGGLTLDKPGHGDKLKAIASGLASATTGPFDVT